MSAQPDKPARYGAVFSQGEIMTDQTQYVDPCPQCVRGGVCDTPTCGRKQSSEYMERYGVPQLGMHITDKEIIRVYAKHVDLVGAAHEIIKRERERCAKICRMVLPQPPFENSIDTVIWNCALNEAAQKIEGES